MTEHMTPTVKSLYGQQLRLIKSTQDRLANNLDNDGTGQKTQVLAKAIFDLASGAQKLEAQLHPASKVER